MERARAINRWQRVLLLLALALALALPLARSASARKPTKRNIKGLIAALRSPSLKVRLAATIGLSKLRARAAVPALITLLRDPKAAVRAVAAAALGRIGDKRALAPLRALIARSTNSFARKLARKALARLSAGAAPGQRRACFAIKVGGIVNRSRGGGAALGHAFAGALRAALRRALPRALVLAPKAAAPSGLPTLVIYGSVRCQNRPAAKALHGTCAISATLASYPLRAMRVFYRGQSSTVMDSAAPSARASYSAWSFVLRSAATPAAKSFALRYLGRLRCTARRARRRRPRSGRASIASPRRSAQAQVRLPTTFRRKSTARSS